MNIAEIIPDKNPLTTLDAVTLAVLVTREVLLLESRIRGEGNQEIRLMIEIERENLMDILRRLMGIEVKHFETL